MSDSHDYTSARFTVSSYNFLNTSNIAQKQLW